MEENSFAAQSHVKNGMQNNLSLVKMASSTAHAPDIIGKPLYQIVQSPNDYNSLDLYMGHQNEEHNDEDPQDYTINNQLFESNLTPKNGNNLQKSEVIYNEQSINQTHQDRTESQLVKDLENQILIDADQHQDETQTKLEQKQTPSYLFKSSQLYPDREKAILLDVKTFFKKASAVVNTFPKPEQPFKEFKKVWISENFGYIHLDDSQLSLNLEKLASRGTNESFAEFYDFVYQSFFDCLTITEDVQTFLYCIHTVYKTQIIKPRHPCRIDFHKLDFCFKQQPALTKQVLECFCYSFKTGITTVGVNGYPRFLPAWRKPNLRYHSDLLDFINDEHCKLKAETCQILAELLEMKHELETCQQNDEVKIDNLRKKLSAARAFVSDVITPNELFKIKDERAQLYAEVQMQIQKLVDSIQQ